MGNIILQTKNISEIDGQFFVPAYQRGYRWEMGYHEPTMKMKRRIKEMLVEKGLEK